jgi:Ca-activated chloride channel homolog
VPAVKVPVCTISYRTDHGIVELNGERVQIPPNDDLMRYIADTTPRAARVPKATTLSLLKQVYRQLGEHIG